MSNLQPTQPLITGPTAFLIYCIVMVTIFAVALIVIYRAGRPGK